MARVSIFQVLEIGRKKALITFIIALLLLIGVLGLIGNVANFHKIFEALRQADKWWFGLCLIGELIAYQGYVFAYRDFARASHGPKLSWWDAVRIVGVGMGANIFGATAASLAVDFWALKKAGAKVHESAWRVLGLNTMEWMELSLLAVAASIAVLLGAGKGAPLYLTLAWIIVIPLCFICARWFTHKKRVAKYTTRPQSPAPQFKWGQPPTWPAWTVFNLRKGFADAIGGVALMRHVIAHPTHYPTGNLGFFAYWIGHLICLFAAIGAFGYVIDPAALVLAYATTYLLTILPLPADGAGGMEAALTYMLHLVGMPLTTAFAAMLVFRFFTFWLPIVPALIFLPMLKNLNEELPKKKRDAGTPRMKYASI